jgi:hypothetical protein
MSNSNKAEVESLGQHCSLSECNRLDFLPVKCDHCLLLFCKDHSSLTAHNCSKQNKESSDCEKRTLTLKPTVFYRCSFGDCHLTSTKEIVEIICDYCKLNHCMKHRLPDDHQCGAKRSLDDENARKSQLKDEQKQAQKKDFKFEMKQNVSEKNAALAAKLTLMKLRQTAMGPPGLPEESKFYCFVQYESSLSNSSGTASCLNKSPCYLNMKWPVGKCVEFLIEKLNLNKANLLKLKLFVNDNLIDSSFNLDKYVKENSLNQGSLLDLKLI